MTVDVITPIKQQHNEIAASLGIYAKAVQRLQQSQERDQDRCLGDILIIVEHLQAQFDGLASSCKEQIVAFMSENGTTGFNTAFHHFHLAKSPFSVLITDEKALQDTRPDLFSTPSPKPDKTAIGKLLRSGQEIPGCTLSNGGAPTLRIKANTTGKMSQ